MSKPTPCAWCRAGAPVATRLDVDLSGSRVRHLGVHHGKPICAACMDAWGQDELEAGMAWFAREVDEPGVHARERGEEIQAWVHRRAAEACRDAAENPAWRNETERRAHLWLRAELDHQDRQSGLVGPFGVVGIARRADAIACARDIIPDKLDVQYPIGPRAPTIFERLAEIQGRWRAGPISPPAAGQMDLLV